MAKKTTIHCDHCDKQVNYDASIGEEYNLGFTRSDILENLTIKNIKYANHSPTSTGYSSSPIEDLVIPENICSKVCFKAYLNDWVEQLPYIINDRF